MYDTGDEQDGKSGEAIAIIAKLRKKRRGGDNGDSEPDPGDDSEPAEGESASSEAELSATEDIGRILAGRELKETEVESLRDALRRFVQSCGEAD